ncbi:hypothetical protein [Coxiella-like endosymbiont]|nr:hypothetical protein [Coxiella-like endosymbiont]
MAQTFRQNPNSVTEKIIKELAVRKAISFFLG